MALRSRQGNQDTKILHETPFVQRTDTADLSRQEDADAIRNRLASRQNSNGTDNCRTGSVKLETDGEVLPRDTFKPRLERRKKKAAGRSSRVRNQSQNPNYFTASGATFITNPAH